MERQVVILTDELYDQYSQVAQKYAEQWKVNDSHVIQIITSVMLHRDGLRNGGGFVQAVVDNNLHQALSRADISCYENLKTIVAAFNYCYI